MTTTTLHTSLLWLAMAAVVVGCGKPNNALFGGDQGPPRVVTTAVQEAVLPFARRFPGETLSQRDIVLVAPVAGFLDGQLAPDGAMVGATAPLYRIRRARYQAEATHAEGALAAAQAQLANAEVTLGRQESLWKNHRNTSEADLANARAQRDQAKAGVTQAEADLERARINLADTEINAPFAGQLGASKVSVGTWLAAGQAVGTLVQLDPLRVRFEVPERLYLAHFADQSGIGRVAVRLRLADGTPFDQTGRIAFFDNRVTAGTGTITAFATVPNPDQRLRPGMYVHVLLERDIGIPSLLIPQAALLNDQLGQYVYVIAADGKAQRRNVTLGDPVDERILILAGLAADERVVVAGLQRLRPGLAVQIGDAAAPPDTAAAARAPGTPSSGPAAGAGAPGTGPRE